MDDEPPVLNLLQILCRQMTASWEPVFVGSGAQALRMLAEQPFDAVVSDMRMPEMNGAELLERVRDHAPRTFRVVLSGYVDPPLAVRSLKAAHQYQSKPLKFPAVESMLTRIFALDRYLADPQLQAAIGGLHRLPTPTAFHARFTRELSSTAAMADALGGLAANDVALTAKLLQLVNSAFFGPARVILTAREAAQALGAPVLRTLNSTPHAVWGQAPDQFTDFPLDRIVKHSLATGLHASRIMSLESARPETVKLAFTAGVLHDIGKIALAAATPEQHRQAVVYGLTEGVPESRAEQAVLGATHGQVGAYLLELWGIPEPVAEVVAWHHEPEQRVTAGFGPLTAVYVANILENQQTSAGGGITGAALNTEYLNALRIDQPRLNRWIQTGLGG